MEYLKSLLKCGKILSGTGKRNKHLLPLYKKIGHALSISANFPEERLYFKRSQFPIHKHKGYVCVKLVVSTATMDLEASEVDPRHAIWGVLSFITVYCMWVFLLCPRAGSIPTSSSFFSFTHSQVLRLANEGKVIQHTRDHTGQGWKWEKAFTTHLLCSVAWDVPCNKYLL